MLATVILLIKNGEAYLDEVLAAIYRQDTGFDFQVIAIDSGSQDRSKEILKRYPVRLVEIAPSTFNHGDTRNLGAHLAGSDTDYLVYLTQDATPKNEHWLASLMAPFFEDEKIAGVFSRHEPRPDSSAALTRQLTTVWQSGSQQRCVKTMPADPAIYERDKLFYIYFSDTSSALRRTVWEQIPFRRLAFAEDADWADRALQAGYRIVFEPASIVIHSHDYSFMEQFRQNADHTAGMKTLFGPQIISGVQNWLRLFGGVPREVWRDWQFTCSEPAFVSQPWRRKANSMFHSPAWHIASALGTWTGAHLDWLPPQARLALSRQERIRKGAP